MDKKNTTIGVALLLAAFAVLYFAPRSAPPTTAPGGEKAAPGAPGAPAVTPGATPTPSHQSTPPPESAVTSAFAAVSHESANATVTTLANDFIEARFTDSGGALREVALKKYPKALGSPAPFVFNELHADPILAFVDLQGLDRNTKFERVSQSADEVVYRAIFNGNLEVTRRYKLAPNSAPNSDPYQIKHETIFRNLSEQPLPGMRVAISLGTAAPTHADDPADQLATGFSTGKDQEFINRATLEPGNGLLGIGAHGAKPAMISSGPFTWTCVKNQFFATIFTTEPNAMSLLTRRVKLLNTLPDDDRRAYGVTGAAQFDVKTLGKGEQTKLTGSLYVGPKEYRRLANTDAFKADESKVMNFGFFKFFSQILLTLMTWIHGFTHNWGVAIILTTLTLKTIFIPFTLAASRSAKRMSKLQPELTAIREKYKDNPQKQQQATMELFKTHKVNPVGGCFPVLITIPFFMGFFTMLRTAAELRFQPFLWAHDLSATDTIAVIPGIGLPLNIMPLLMGATMIIQMHLTPTPSVDNAQVKMMKFMPYMFTLFCYNFSCALSLYSFTNGLFTIGQQLVINKMKDEPGGPASPSAAAASTASMWKKGTKNVTPKKK